MNEPQSLQEFLDLNTKTYQDQMQRAAGIRATMPDVASMLEADALEQKTDSDRMAKLFANGGGIK